MRSKFTNASKNRLCDFCSRLPLHAEDKMVRFIPDGTGNYTLKQACIRHWIIGGNNEHDN